MDKALDSQDWDWDKNGAVQDKKTQSAEPSEYSDSNSESEPIRDNVPIAAKGSVTCYLLIAVCFAAFGASFTFGYNIAVINQPEEQVKRWINESHDSVFHEELPSESLTLIWSTIVSVFAVGGMFGALLTSVVADRFGRKRGMLYNNLLALVAALILGISKVVGFYPLLVLGRLVIGFNAGLNSALCPMYLTEISPIHLRGTFGSIHQLVITISIFVSLLVGMPFALGTDQLWPLLFALTALPAFYQYAFACCVPESPKFLLINQEKFDESKQVLVALRGTSDIFEEIESMEDEVFRKQKGPKLVFIDMFRRGTLAWPLFLSVMMMLAQQVTGINAIMFYSTGLFKSAGLKDLDAKWASVGMGAINVVTTIVAVLIIDRFGRRIIFLGGLLGMFLACIALVVCLWFVQKDSTMAGYFAIGFVFIYVVSFAIGPGPIPWFFVSELFELKARGYANAVAVVCNWSSNFLVGLLFPVINNKIQGFTFAIFAINCLLFGLFTYAFVPETKGKSVESIVSDFKKKIYWQPGRK